MTSRLDALEPSDTALHWPGPLPTFTIAGLSVSTAEERARLVGLAAGVSNVELPTGVTVGGGPLDLVVDEAQDDFEPGRPPPDPICAFTLPNDEDAIHGAMSMALWAVPHIDPWLNLLTASLAAERAPHHRVESGCPSGPGRLAPGGGDSRHGLHRRMPRRPTRKRASGWRPSTSSGAERPQTV